MTFFTPAGPLSGLSLRFLGDFRVDRGDGRALSFPYDKVRGLLAYLVLEPGEHPRETLAQLLWPELDGMQARANLRRCVFDLRRALGEAPGTEAGWVGGGKKTLSFGSQAPWQADVVDFERAPPAVGISPEELAQRLEQQLQLYQGPLLNGLSLPDAPEFEAWLLARREALHKRALGRLEELIAHHEQRHAPQRALQHARRAIELEPWREALQRSYLRLLARHSPEAALAHFDSLQRQLQAELGVPPEAQTLALVEQIRRQIDGAAAPAAPWRIERRHLVALACELEAGPDLEPDEAALQMAQALSAAAACAQAHDGHVAQALRGELLVFFGYPNAQEHSPREAVEAALELAQALGAYPGLRWRAGAHAGWSLSRPQGDTPDESGSVSRMARRLALLGPADALVVSEPLARLLRRYPHYRLEPGPAAASAALAEAGPALRLTRQPAAAGAVGHEDPQPVPLIGRQAELARLQARWQQVRQGGRAGLLLRAEAGLGKSRLAAALARELRQSGTPVLSLSCQAESAHTPYFALVEGLQTRLGLSTGQDRPVPANIAHALTELGLDGSDPLQLLPALLDSRPQAPGAEALHPAERKQHEQTLLCELIERLGRGQPLLLQVEDLHWADAATQQTLARLLQRTGPPLLLLATSRRPAPAALAGAALEELELKPLSTHAARELVVALTAGTAQAPDEAWQAAIVARADGVPLYVEELTRSLLAGPGEQVPDTLWDVLAARLDSLGPAKHIAQLGAAIGRDFSDRLLQALGEPAERVSEGLAAMLRAGLLRRERTGVYHFKHALVRDAAYQSLPPQARRDIHARLAAVLRTHFAERLQAHPEILAHHLSEATDPSAAQAWLAAGRQAAMRSAHAEALHDFHAGLAALQALAPGDAYRARLEPELLIAQGTLLVATEGYGSEAARDCFLQAWALSAQAPAELDRFALMWGLWMVGRSSADEHPLEFADRLREQAGPRADAATQLAVAYAYGNNTLWLGRLAQAQAHLEQALALAGQVTGAELIRRFGEDIGVAARALLSWVYWLQGRLAAALALAEDNVAQARRLDHAHSLGYALGCAAVLQRHLGHVAEAATLSRELLAHGQRHQLLLWQAGGVTVLGWTLAVAGDDGGLDTLHQGVAGARQAFRLIELTFMHILADALLLLRRPEEALAVVDEALTRARLNHDLYLVPDFLRLQADALLQAAQGRASDARQAEARAARLYQQGWEQARSDGAHLLALRCAIGLARLAPSPAQVGPARDRLRESLARVQALAAGTCPELRAAAALLAEGPAAPVASEAF